MNYSSSLGTEIAIIGMSGRFPGARNLDEFWHNLQGGVESISFFSEQELEASGIDRTALNDPHYVRAKPVLDDIELFDALFFSFSPREAETMDPQHRLFLECAWAALENAGYDAERFADPIGVYAGAGINAYLLFNLYAHHGLRASFADLQTVIMHGNDKDYLATRVSYKLNLRGPSLCVQTACSTSLVAVHLACQSLLSGECDLALAGGVSITVPQKAGYLYQEGGILSPDGHCRAFDAQAQGTIFGNGMGVVVLKRLAEALADGDCIHAVIKGSAINNDGSLKAGYTAPSVDGQAGVILEALAMARIKPETLTYIEAHGTGTDLGDPIEIEALIQAFRTSTDKTGFCGIGSVKTNIGHLDRAAGIAGLLKTVLALKHKMIPPSLHFERPNPKIDFANSPFYVNTRLAEWKTEGIPRRAGVSSFGIGGTNAHIILEEAPPLEPSGPSRPWQLLLLSAKTDSALDAATANLAAHLKLHPDLNPSGLSPSGRSLADVAYTLQTGRRAFNCRRCVVCQDADNAVSALETPDVSSVCTASAPATTPPVVFMFPGQGAQHVNMAAELYRLEPTFRAEVDRCCELLQPLLQLDLRGVLYPPAAEAAGAAYRLDQTGLTQPALFVIEYALAQLWLAWGVRPVATIGHSIGEYTAACLAGVFSLEDALMLVAARGRLMQQLTPGAMLAVLLPQEEVIPLLGQHLDLAAVNGSSRCVVSGPTHLIEVLHKQLAARQIVCHRLHTSHAFHSAMMNPILEPFTQQVARATLKPPQIPFVSNLTGVWITTAEATSPIYWARHLRQTVHFAEGVQRLEQETGGVLLEVGPGQTLGTLVREQLDEVASQKVLSSLPHPRDQGSAVASLLNALGRLWLAGVQVDWSRFYAHERRHRLPLPNYPFERKRYWIEPLGSEPDGGLRDAQEQDQAFTSHPLIGRPSSASPVIQFESQLSLHSLSYLYDHQLDGTVILPFTAYVEMALSAAARALEEKPYSLAELVIEKDLFLPEGEDSKIRLIAVPRTARDLDFVVIGEQQGEWTRHAIGKICQDQSDPTRHTCEQESLEAIQSRCPDEISAAEFYQMREGGIQLGPAFQGVEQIWRRDGEALGRIQLPEAIAAQVSMYQIHPAFLDACLQVLAATVPTFVTYAARKSFVFIPIGCRSVVIYERPDIRLWSHALLRSGRELNIDTVEGDVRLLDEVGHIVVEVRGFRLKLVERTDQHGARENLEDWLYQVQWQPKEYLESKHDPEFEQAGSWLILADETGLAQKTAAMLEARGETCVMVTPGGDHTVSEPGECHLDPVRLEELQQLIRDRFGPDQPPCRGVIHLWSLDAPSPEEAASTFLQTAQTLGGVSVLNLVKTLAGAKWPAPPQLWLVTRGAQQVERGQKSISVAQAPLWGLGKVIAFEHPELECVRVDLDPLPEEGEAEQLFQELWSQDHEDQVAFRNRVRYVPRLVKYSPPQTPGVTQPEPSKVENRLVAPEAQAFGLAVPEPGSLDGLRLLPQIRQNPSPGQVEIQVYTAGLNFADLLEAMNLYPGSGDDAIFLGGECAGKVVALGEGVTGFQVGDEVIALAPSSISTFVTTAAQLIMPKPAHLSFEEAATIPIAFITAYYALHRVGRLGRGERILIHSAAGGVGLAAAQVARWTGAEIFATAGNPEKRAFLESLGIEHVMDSSSLAFAEEIMRRTDGQGVDVILNSLPGEAIPKGLSVLRPFGRFLDISKTDIYQNSPLGLYPFRKNLSYVGIDLGQVFREHPTLAQSLFREVMEHFKNGTFKPLPLLTFPVQDAVSGFLYMARRKNIGKIVFFLPAPIDTPHLDSSIVFRPNSTYLITGGLGGLGLKVAQWMVQQGARHLVLLGRKEPSSSVKHTLSELEAGAQIVVVQADVSERDQVANVLAHINNSMPPLRGIIHAAGVLDDDTLLRLDEKRFARVLAPKVDGAWNLHALTSNVPLDFFVLFSSATSVLGSLGQGSYAAANAFLDALAHYRRAHGLPALSINWGPWAGAGMAARAYKENAFLARQQVAMIPPGLGLKILERLLPNGAPQIAVLPYDLQQRLGFYSHVAEIPMFSKLFDGNGAIAKQADSSSRLQPPPRVTGECITARTEAEIEQIIADIWRRMLGVDQIGPHDKFFELGGNSLIGIQVMSQLNRVFQVHIPPVSLYEGATVSSLASIVANIMSDRQSARPHIDQRRDRGEKRREQKKRRKEISEKHQEENLNERLDKA